LISFMVFHTPILAATTHAAYQQNQFIAECNKHAGVLQKIAPKNIFSMAIHTRLGKANRPGRGWSGLVQSQFHPSTEGKLVVGVRFPLHTTVKIAELLLQVSSLKNDVRYDRAKIWYFASKRYESPTHGDFCIVGPMRNLNCPMHNLHVCYICSLMTDARKRPIA